MARPLNPRLSPASLPRSSSLGPFFNPLVWISHVARCLPSVAIFQSVAWGCLGTSLLAVPLALDPVNVTGDPAISAKILTLRLIQTIWLVSLLLAWGQEGCGRCRIRWMGPPGLALGMMVVALWGAALASGRFWWCFQETGHLLLLPVLVLGTLALGPPRPGLPVAAIAAAFLGGLICAAYGIGVMIGWDPLRSVYPFVYARDDARNFLHSFLGNPEYFGGYSASLSAAAAGWFLFSRSWWARLCGFAVSVVMAACVVLSGTRAALLVLLLVGLSLLICRWPTLPGLARRRILQAAAVLAVLGVLGIGVLSTENPLNPRGMRLAQRFLNLSDFNSASVKERMLFYAIAAETSGRNPWLGAGPGSYQLEFYPRLLDMDERDESGVIARLMYDLRNRVAEQAHSDWLQAWSEGGVLGGAAFALLGAALLVRFGCWIRDRNRLVDTPLELGDALVAAGWAGATCLYLNSAFSFPLQMSARASLFYGFFAVFVAGQWMVRRVGSMDDSSSHRVS